MHFFYSKLWSSLSSLLYLFVCRYCGPGWSSLSPADRTVGSRPHSQDFREANNILGGDYTSPFGSYRGIMKAQRNSA